MCGGYAYETAFCKTWASMCQTDNGQLTNWVHREIGEFWIYIQHVNLRAARQFTCCPYIYGHLIPTHAPHFCVITQLSRYQSKGKITRHDPKHLSTWILIFSTPLCKSNGTFSLDMDINGLILLLWKYKTSVIKCYILICCLVNLVSLGPPIV